MSAHVLGAFRFVLSSVFPLLVLAHKIAHVDTRVF